MKGVKGTYAVSTYFCTSLARQEAVDSIVVEHKGKEFQGDEISQDRMVRVILSLSDKDVINWVAYDNTEVELTKADLQTILAQAREQQSSIWNKDRPKLEEINNSD